MIQRSIRSTAVFAVAALLLGCSSPMDPARVAKIVPGSTTLAEARHILGKPDSQLGSQGQVLVRYFTSQEMGRDSRSGQSVHLGSSLDLLADTNGVIQKVHRYDSRTHIKPSVRDERIVGPDLSEESLARIETGRTTGSRMKDTFGPPTEEILGFRGTMLRRWVEIRQNRGSVTGLITYLEVEFDDRDVVTGLSTKRSTLFH